jgi:hypothetical protein
MAMDEDSLTEEEMATLKRAFAEADCAVKDLNESCFEISHKEYPVVTHVYATPYFLQLSTVMVARPKGFPFRTRAKLYAFLNRANSSAKMARFSVDGEKVNPDFGGWLVMASVKFIKGTTGGEWDKDALKNCLLLWLQDIAEFILLPSPFGFVAMKRE